jgi:hypothetical protein
MKLLPHHLIYLFLHDNCSSKVYPASHTQRSSRRNCHGSGIVASTRAIHRSTDPGASLSRLRELPGVGADQGLDPGLAFDRASPQTLYAVTSDDVWAYTLPTKAGELPKLGDPIGDAPPYLLALGAALQEWLPGEARQRSRATSSLTA